MLSGLFVIKVHFNSSRKPKDEVRNRVLCFILLFSIYKYLLWNSVTQRTQERELKPCLTECFQSSQILQQISKRIQADLHQDRLQSHCGCASSSGPLQRQVRSSNYSACWLSLPTVTPSPMFWQYKHEIRLLKLHHNMYNKIQINHKKQLRGFTCSGFTLYTFMYSPANTAS